MEKYIYDKNNGLWYKLAGRLLQPLLESTGSRRKTHRHLGTEAPAVHQGGAKALYTELLATGRLNTYLANINEQATAQMCLLITQMAEREDVTEQLKAHDQMLWVQRMNNIRDRAMEIVNQDLIYA